MKILAAVFSMFVAVNCFAAPSTFVEISPVVSTVLTSQKFSQAIESVRQKVGRAVRVDSLGSMSIGQQEIVSIGLLAKVREGGRLSYNGIGSITAILAPIGGGEFKILGLYFKPDAEPPPAGGVIN